MKASINQMQLATEVTQDSSRQVAEQMCGCNVLFVNHSLDMGGIETMIRDFSLALAGTRYRPSVAVFDALGEIGGELVSKGIPVAELHKREGLDWRLVGRLREVVCERQVKVVHSNNYSAWLYSVLAVRGTNARVLHTEHSKVLGGWRRHVLERLLAYRTDAIVAVSNEVRRAMIEDIGIAPTQVRVIENGVDLERFSRDQTARESWRRRLEVPDSTVVLGIVARLVPVKDHATLIRAFGLLRARGIAVRLVVAGDGPSRTELKALVGDLHLDDDVTFLGEVRSPASLLSALDIYVLSSRDEGMNLTLLEAMGSSLPLVATAVGGNPEVVGNEVTGILVPPASPEALAGALERLVFDSGLRMRMGQAGRDRVARRFSQASTIRAYTELYDQILEIRA